MANVASLDSLTLRVRAFSAIRWTALAAIAHTIVQLGQIAVLARLLAPEDYGLMIFVSVVLSFAGLFADAGMNRAYVQRRDTSLEQRSSLFWMNMLLALAVTVTLIGLSPVVAWYVEESRLIPLVSLSSSTVIIGALGQQVRMTAEKELNFRPLVMLEVFSTCMGFAAALVAALAGWGVYSLVLAATVSTTTLTVLTWVVLAHGWWPMFRLRWTDLRPFIGFGGASIANDVVSQINFSSDVFLGGRLLSVAQLGIYSVPRNLTLQIQFVVNGIVTRIGFPLIAQVQSDVFKVRSIYLSTLNMTASTNALIYVGLVFFAPEAVMLLLGTGWESSAELLRILAIWGGVRSTANPVGSLLFGMGRADLEMKWNGALLFVVPPVIWFASRFGAEGIAWAMLALQVGLFVPSWYFLVRPLCNCGLREYATSALRPFLLALSSVAPAYALAMNFADLWSRLAIGIVVSSILYFGFSVKANPEWTNAIVQLLGGRRAEEQT
jgi:O-antigen/teichoic acid export membrane protein